MARKIDLLATARSNTYQFLALAFGYPEAAILAQLKNMLACLEASLEAQEDRKCLAVANTIGADLETLTNEDWHSVYLRCFGHTTSKDCPPYETEYGQTHIFRKSHNLADIAGFYRAFGVELAADLNDRWDHISVELEFMQFLCAKESYALAHDHAEESLTLCRDAQIEFLDQHLGRWAIGFAHRLGNKTSDGLYSGLGKLLQTFLTSELRRFDLQPETEMPPLLEEELQETASGCQDCTLINPATDLNEVNLHEQT